MRHTLDTNDVCLSMHAEGVYECLRELNKDVCCVLVHAYQLVYRFVSSCSPSVYMGMHTQSYAHRSSNKSWFFDAMSPPYPVILASPTGSWCPHHGLAQPHTSATRRRIWGKVPWRLPMTSSWATGEVSVRGTDLLKINMYGICMDGYIDMIMMMMMTTACSQIFVIIMCMHIWSCMCVYRCIMQREWMWYMYVNVYMHKRYAHQISRVYQLAGVFLRICSILLEDDPT